MIEHILLLTIGLFTARVLFLMYKSFLNICEIKSDITLKTLICIGSGGHTTEMLRIVGRLNGSKYLPRIYVLAENDMSSKIKIQTFEDRRDYEIRYIPRSRNVNQSYFTSIFSTLRATIHSIPIVYKFKPSIVLSNGPGTCIPLCIVAFFLRCLFIIDCRIVFIESICRVQSLSLSGKILQFFADVFIIQWPQLRNACFRVQLHYFGRLT